MRRIAERAGVALGLVAGGQLQPARVDIGRQVLRAPVPDAGDLGDGDAPRRTDDVAALDAHVLAPGLQQAGADLQDALGQLVAGRGDRAARHDHAARAPGAGGVGRLGGVAVHEADAIMRDAKDGMRDLGQRGLQALAVAVRADPELERRHRA